MQRITDTHDPQSQTTLWQAYRPSMASGAASFLRAAYQDTTLTFREGEAARIRISHINGCIPCSNFRVNKNLPELLSRLVPDEYPAVTVDRGDAPSPAFYDVIATWRSSDLFSERERLAIEYAERIAESPRDLPDDDVFWNRMSANFDDGEIVDLTYGITAWIATGRFVHVLGLDSVCPTFRPAALRETLAA